MLPMNNFRIMLSLPVGTHRIIRIIITAIPANIPANTPHMATIFSAEFWALAASKWELHIGTFMATVADPVPRE